MNRRKWIERVKAETVAGVDYAGAVALQARHLDHKAATGEDLPEYAAKLDQMRRIAQERGIRASSGTLSYYHALIAGTAIKG